MAYTFDGTTKIISLTLGTTSVDVRDLYSRWKDWVQSASEKGSKYLQAMSIVGGDPIDESAGIYVTAYVFLINGWKVRPQEADHTLNVTEAVLLTDTGVDPFVATLGAYNVQIKYSQPIKSETISTAGGGGGLTAEEHDQLMTEVATVDDLGELLTTGKFLALK